MKPFTERTAVLLQWASGPEGLAAVDRVPAAADFSRVRSGSTDFRFPFPSSSRGNVAVVGVAWITRPRLPLPALNRCWFHLSAIAILQKSRPKGGWHGRNPPATTSAVALRPRSVDGRL